jgi:hypothetical protein
LYVVFANGGNDWVSLERGRGFGVLGRDRELYHGGEALIYHIMHIEDV